MKPKKKVRKSGRHTWMLSIHGDKICRKCNSRIQNKSGFPKYYEGGNYKKYVNWYPRCIDISPTPITIPVTRSGHGKPKPRKK